MSTKYFLLASLSLAALFLPQCTSSSSPHLEEATQVDSKKPSHSTSAKNKQASSSKNNSQTASKAVPNKQAPSKKADASIPKSSDQQVSPPKEGLTGAPKEVPVQTGPTHSRCGAQLPPPNFSRADVYKGRPFQPGESADYEVSYMGVHAGYGNLSVDSPIKHEGIWHQAFSGSASTGEWYEKIFIVKDKIHTVSRPWDFGAAQFYIEQNEGSFFGRRFTQKKWITFDQSNCKVFERTENRKKEIKNDEYELEPGANDALAAFFALRTIHYIEGRTERVLVYTSEKNWHLDATPVAFETITVPAGTFKTIKLKLVTYLGKELQQKGEVHMWIATDHPARPMIRVEAEVKVGKIQIKLKKFDEGKS